MNGMLEKISQTAAKVRPGAYGEWAARFAGYFALLGTGLSALVGGWDGPVTALLFFMAFDLFSGFAAACKNALYLVPASAPPMVAWSIPRMASCSSRGTLAVVADAPRLWILCAMPEPEVLKARTLSEMPAENISPNWISDRSL